MKRLKKNQVKRKKSRHLQLLQDSEEDEEDDYLDIMGEIPEFDDNQTDDNQNESRKEARRSGTLCHTSDEDESSGNESEVDSEEKVIDVVTFYESPGNDSPTASLENAQPEAGAENGRPEQSPEKPLDEASSSKKSSAKKLRFDTDVGNNRWKSCQENKAMKSKESLKYDQDIGNGLQDVAETAHGSNEDLMNLDSKIFRNFITIYLVFYAPAIRRMVEGH